MSLTTPWYDGISPEHQALAASLVRLVEMGVDHPKTVSASYCRAVVARCRAALEEDPNLLDLVGYVHGITCGEVVDEFTANGATTLARRWMRVGDRLRDLTGMDALGGP